jgi:hypothetical protein
MFYDYGIEEVMDLSGVVRTNGLFEQWLGTDYSVPETVM